MAGAVEEKVIASGLGRITTGLVRELVDNELFERGLTGRLERQKVIGMPRFDLENLIYSKSQENSNITSNNPEAINLSIAETVLKQFALSEIFSRPVAEAHLTARLHLHDLGYPTRVYCSSHSLEYLKKYGLELQNLDTKSGPAKHARTLTGHLNTFLASMQAYYAGALGVGYINIMYAPYVEQMTDAEMLQEAQHLIFSCSQSAFSRGGQTLFLDFNIHTGVPRYLKDIEAIGPGGKYMGRTYGSYEKAAQRFCKAMLDVWRVGRPRRAPVRVPEVRLPHQRRVVQRPGPVGAGGVRVPDRLGERRAVLRVRPRRGDAERLLPPADGDHRRLHDHAPGEHAVLRVPERDDQPAAGRLPGGAGQLAETAG